MKISKNNYSPNDRFLIKIFIKIISLDSSQRVPPLSPCPPLIITTVCPWLINHLSDPWDFNKSNGILLRSNWRKPYPIFYGSECLLLNGDQENDLQGRVLTFWGGGGWLIRCWHYSAKCSLEANKMKKLSTWTQKTSWEGTNPPQNIPQTQRTWIRRNWCSVILEMKS